MFSKKFIKKYSGVKKESIWQGWRDVVNWPKWDNELEYCNFSGDFVVGNTFMLKPKGSPKVRVTLSAVESNARFVSFCHFVGARMENDHYVYDDSDGVRIEQTVCVKGPLAFLWWHLVAKNVAKAVSEQTGHFINYVRTHHA